MDEHEKYTQLTGKSWIAALMEWQQLDQRVHEAAAQYIKDITPHDSEERKQLESALRAKHAEADAYWKQMWEDLDRC